MNFDDMPWVVSTDEENYGPLTKAAAVELRDALRRDGLQAEAWAAQLPNERLLTPVRS